MASQKCWVATENGFTKMQPSKNAGFLRFGKFGDTFQNKSKASKNATQQNKCNPAHFGANFAEDKIFGSQRWLHKS